MPETTVATLPDPSGFSPDPLTRVIRDGARKLIEQAMGAELTALMAAFVEDKLEDGRARLVRHGHLPERGVLTGIGPVPVDRHVTGGCSNKRAEVSHQPTRRRERQQRRFKSPLSAQRFLASHAAMANHFNVRRIPVAP